MPKPRILKGRIWKIYFESLYEKEIKPKDHRVHSCVVIAKDATEAMQKAVRAFPGQRVTFLNESDPPYAAAGERPKEATIVL